MPASSKSSVAASKGAATARGAARRGRGAAAAAAAAATSTTSTTSAATASPTTPTVVGKASAGVGRSSLRSAARMTVTAGGSSPNSTSSRSDTRARTVSSPTAPEAARRTRTRSRQGKAAPQSAVASASSAATNVKKEEPRAKEEEQAEEQEEEEEVACVPGSEEELSLPKATVSKFLQEILPPEFKCAKVTQELLISCCVEFVHLVSSEANDICERESRKTIGPDHVIGALETLGFAEYVPEVRSSWQENREFQKERDRISKRSNTSGTNIADQEKLAREQEEMFERARIALQQQQQQEQQEQR